MKNLLQVITLVAGALLLSSNVQAQQAGMGRSFSIDSVRPGNGQNKIRLERQVKRFSKQIQKKLAADADTLSVNELMKTKLLLEEVKNTLGLPMGPGHGGGHGGGHGSGRPNLPVCEIKYQQSSYYNYYFVYKDGQKFSSGYSSFADAAKQKDQFVQSGACQDQPVYQLPLCSVKYVKSSYYNYYKVYVGNELYSSGYSSVDDAAEKLEEFTAANVCQTPMDHELEPCSIDLITSSYYNYYYVMQNGEKLSSGYSSFGDANNFKQKLEDSYMCSKY